MQPKFFELAPIIKAVLFHFQILVYGCIYGIKCNIAKKNSAVDLKERHNLCELLRRFVQDWSSFAQNLEKAHLPKTMKSPSFPESYEFTLSNKNQSVVCFA